MAADVFLCAGEASGDLQASLLAAQLLAIDPGLRIEAVGGERLRGAGARVVLDSVASEWASMGHLRAYVKIPWLLWIMLGIARRLLADPPRLVVCVDFGAFNLRMLEWLRFCGYRGVAIYYFPPGAWTDVPAQARKVARVATALTPLAHQAEFYERLGLPVEYFGHPLAGRIAARSPRAIAHPPTIAIAPGSRDEEIALHLPVLAAAALALQRERGARFTVIAASPKRARRIAASWPAECGGESAVVCVPLDEAIADADLAWVASGTAVLEAALRGVPLISFYRVGPAQYRIIERRLPRIARGPITLPNLVTGRAVVPELLQDAFRADALVRESVALLDDASVREAQAGGVELFRRMLGPPNALAKIGAYVAGMLAKTPAR